MFSPKSSGLIPKFLPFQQCKLNCFIIQWHNSSFNNMNNLLLINCISLSNLNQWRNITNWLNSEPLRLFSVLYRDRNVHVLMFCIQCSMCYGKSYHNAECRQSNDTKQLVYINTGLKKISIWTFTAVYLFSVSYAIRSQSKRKTCRVLNVQFTILKEIYYTQTHTQKKTRRFILWRIMNGA